MAKLFRYLFLLLCLTTTAAQSEEKNTPARKEPSTTIDIPLRDGISLQADVYLPPSGNQNLPCILVRTPSGRTGFDVDIVTALTHQDYIVVVQETRSAQDPEGRTLPFLTDYQDGYDTIAWLANSPWSNGKVGTAGTSALGITQHFLAATNPEPLSAQYIRFGAPSLRKHVMFQGGQLCKELVEGWLSRHVENPAIYAFIMEHAEDLTFWDHFDTLKASSSLSTPAVHIGGWFDVFLGGTLEAFQHRNEKSAGNAQKLVIGPWSHFWPRHQMLGDFVVPENGREIPEVLSEQAWFDYHLKGQGPDISSLPSVHYYLMGPLDGSSSIGNEWKTADTWPIPAEKQQFFLADRSCLTSTLPQGKRKHTFHSNPNNPTPTHGGRNLFIPSGPKDQREVEAHDDIILFTTEPLEEDMEVTGPVSMKLFLSTNIEDSAVAVRLCDVYPDGKSVLITDGLTRICTPDDAITEVEVDLAATSQVFAKGHRIRVSIAGTNYPRFELPKKPSKTVILSSEEYPSHLLLPVVF